MPPVPSDNPFCNSKGPLDGGKPKAQCTISAAGHSLSIPMPGHSIPLTAASLAEAKAAVQKLEQLFDEHDALFLLMDSSESRWLPIVLGAAKRKLSLFYMPLSPNHPLNAPMPDRSQLCVRIRHLPPLRHGARTSSLPKDDAQPTRLGCYCCTNIVAPSDERTQFSLPLSTQCCLSPQVPDRLCPTTDIHNHQARPKHPSQQPQRASSLRPSSRILKDLSNTQSYAEHGGSVLGIAPRQLHNFLAQFRNMCFIEAAYDKCIECSEIVIQAYEKDGFDTLLNDFNGQKFLETLTGLGKLFKEGEAALESVDWEEEGDGKDDF